MGPLSYANGVTSGTKEIQNEEDAWMRPQWKVMYSDRKKDCDNNERNGKLEEEEKCGPATPRMESDVPMERPEQVSQWHSYVCNPIQSCSSGSELNAISIATGTRFNPWQYKFSLRLNGRIISIRTR